MNRKIRDNLILNLIETGLKAKILFNEKWIEHASGTRTQKEVFITFIKNVYLNELDKYIETLEIEYLGPSNR